MLRVNKLHIRMSDNFRERITPHFDKTTAFIRSVSKKQFDGSDTREIEIKLRSLSGTYSGEQYLMGILLPDFFFHIATAHAILRHRGLAIGKVDYLGHVSR